MCNDEKIMYSTERLQEIISQNGNLSPSLLVKELSLDMGRYEGEVEPDDDRAILVIHFKNKS